MSLVPVMDISNGQFVLRCVKCKGLFPTNPEFNEHPCYTEDIEHNEEPN